MQDPYKRRVYLQTLAHPSLPARYSQGAQRRTGQLQQFLAGLHQVATPHLKTQGSMELLVINQQDWRKLFSYTYGLPFTRSKKNPDAVSIVIPADYPSRLLRRFDPILIQAAKNAQQAPGDLREFLDLLAGHEWGHASANLSGLRTKVKWFDELMATYLFLLSLQDSGADAILERFIAWAQVQVAGGSVERADLGAFEYPRVKLPLTNLLWFQGMFTLRANELLNTHGWDFPLNMKNALTTHKRGDVARALLDVDPGFKDWFKVFANNQTPQP